MLRSYLVARVIARRCSNAARIAWEAGFEFLDQELQEIVRDADLGKQRVDKLVKVRRLDGATEWILAHVEVQGQPEEGLPRRLYQYHHRIVDRFGMPTVTLAFLADESPDWRPSIYEEETWGCRVRFEYPICKLLDFGGIEALEQIANPVAVVMAAHLTAQQTRPEDPRRFGMKKMLVRRLYEQNHTRDEVLQLFRLIDWLLAMPAGLEQQFSL